MVRGLGVADVLCALEDAESERGQEVASGQQPSRGSQGKSGLSAQEVGHFLELRYLIGPDDALVFHHLESPSVLLAGVLRHQLDDGLVDGTPGLDLVLDVFDFWDLLATTKQNVI